LATARYAAARPSTIRSVNEQLLLGHIRRYGPCSRAELAAASGLSKVTVSVALDNVERAGLVRIAGQRTGAPGRPPQLYELRPDAGLVLGVSVDQEYVRGALAGLSGEIRARSSVRARAGDIEGRAADLVRLADVLCSEGGVSRAAITQTVISGSCADGAHRDSTLPDWDWSPVLTRLRDEFGPSLALQRDLDARALAERALGHGQDTESFAFVHFGIVIRMALVIGGHVVPGAHGAAGEIAVLPVSGGTSAGRHAGPGAGTLQGAACEASMVGAARRAGLDGALTARRVFDAAAAGNQRAAALVAKEARLAAEAICAVVTVVDPELIVLDGSIGRAPGFARLVGAELRLLTPVRPDIKVSTLDVNAVVDGCLAVGAELAWTRVMDSLHPPR